MAKTLSIFNLQRFRMFRKIYNSISRRYLELTISLLVAIFATSLLIAMSFYTVKSYIGAHSLADKLEISSSSIKYYDEVLTMSARMGAFTGDAKWEQRYNDAEPKLDEAIKYIANAYPNVKNILDAIDVANQKLILLERKSFDYVNHHQQSEAVDVITSTEYENQKALYKKGLDALLSELNILAKDIDSKQKKNLTKSLVLIVILLTATLFALRSSYKAITNLKELKKVSEEFEDLMSGSEIGKHLTELIEVVSATIEMRDPYTAGHQKRVAELGVAIGKKLNLPDRSLISIKLAGLVHDLGKMRVPLEILVNPSKLSKGEMSMLQEHPNFAYEVLKNLKSPWALADIVNQHHERYDGSGYPNKLKKDNILIEARVLAVADVVEAMTAMRPYREGLGIDAALNEIKSNSGIKYDPQVVNACIELFETSEFSW